MKTITNKNGATANLLQDTDIQQFNINANSGYTIIYNHSFQIGDKVFLIIGIRKDNGVFDVTDQVPLYADEGVDFKAMTNFCALGEYTDWNVDTVGYCFVSGRNIIVSDRNILGKQDRAYINMVCVKQ